MILRAVQWVEFAYREVDANPSKKTPEVIEKLKLILDEETAGDPMTSQKWVRQSLRQLRKTLDNQQMQLSHETIRRVLKAQKYSLKANRKSISESGTQRDCQFRYIRRVKKLFLAAGHPVISVDTKKKELIGNFKNPGRAWRQQAALVNCHDFPQEDALKAIPYGIYDVVHNLGYVYVGTTTDTAEFAVDAISRWWQRKDRPEFVQENRLLILCDAGGSNGYRIRNWKKRLQVSFVERFDVEVMVCHYPTGASKWNPIEHRLFSFISLNWAAQPLRSLPIMLAFIRGTITAGGLKVKASVLKKKYRKQIKVSDQEMASLNIVRRKVCPHWNYIIKPRSNPPEKM